MKTLSQQKDNLWFIVIAIIILLFTSIPYKVAKSAETNNLLFRGTFYDESDYSVHISMMQAGRMGDWSYKMRFTSEEHNAAYIRLFYIALGHISKWIGLEVESTFHLARLILGFIALLSIYKLLQKIFPNPNHVRAAFLLATLGAGIGWLQLILGAPLEPVSPIDFWLIDAYVFFSISLFPSFSFTLALMASVLTFFLEYLNTEKWQTILIICILAVVSQFTNPIAFASINIAFLAVMLMMWLEHRQINYRHLSALVLIGSVQLPALTYNYLVLNNDPFWKQFTLQNQTLSPSPIFYFWGFFPFWIFALYGIVLAFRQRNISMTAMMAWAVSSMLLAYLPVAIQRRFTLGITIPLAALAIYGLCNLLKHVPSLIKRENIVYIAYALFSSVSSIYLILGTSLFLQAQPASKFYPRDLENALIWLNKNAAPNDFVLANISSSQLVAQRTDLRVYVGHEMETIDYKNKIADMEAFYKGTQPQNWVEKRHIQWVIYGPYEKEILGTFKAGVQLEKVYTNNTVTIYKVTASGQSSNSSDMSIVIQAFN